MDGIVFGCIVPHPPVLIPQVGRGREGEVPATAQAMEDLARELARHRPQTLLIISPHGAVHYNAMGLSCAPSSRGDLRRFGAPAVSLSFDNDLEMVAAIEKEAAEQGVSVRLMSPREYVLDHGVLVPMHFLSRALPDVTLVPLTFSWLPLKAHLDFGRVLQQAAERVGKRVAIIASGDLSHRLLPSSPAGYDPQAKLFDKLVVDAVANWDVQALMDLGPQLIDTAGECGLRSIVTVMGALEGLVVKPQLLSYQSSLGEGYLVAALPVVGAVEAALGMHALVRLAKDMVESFVREGKLPELGALTPEMEERAGAFVSIKEHGELRGCIGTFEPTRPNVAEEIITSAVNSASRDPRFPPITLDELPHLTYSVDILSKPEPIDSSDKLDPRRYGVIVQSGGRRGLLLPDLEGVNTVEQQIEIACLKAGILPGEPVRLYRFEVKRYT